MIALALVSPRRSGHRGLLRSVSDIVSTLATPKLLIPTLLYVLAILGILIPASHFGLWEPSLWKTTVTWLLVSGLGLLFNLSQAIDDAAFFRRAALRTLGVVGIVEFIANLESFALWVEIPGQLLAVTAVAAVTTASLAEAPAQRRVASTYLGIYGLCALVWGAWNLIGDWSDANHGMLIREFLMPIWLTPVALLMVYAYAVLAAYESTFIRMRIVKQRGSLARQRLALVLRAGIWLPYLRLVRGQGAHRIARTDGFREAWAVVGQIRQEHREQAKAEAAEERRLIDNAGRVGADEFGRQFDRRGHAETQAALRRVAMSQMGHYRNGGTKYRGDLLPILEPGFKRDGLSLPHGIAMHVAADGQSWYAERQTITRYCFAIGAVGPPPDQWLFAGPERPSGFPDDAEWDHWGGGQHSLNWD